MPSNRFPDGLLQRAAHRALAAQRRAPVTKLAVQPVRRGHPQRPERQASVRELGRRLLSSFSASPSLPPSPRLLSPLGVALGIATLI